MRISDWSSDVCSSDLARHLPSAVHARGDGRLEPHPARKIGAVAARAGGGGADGRGRSADAGIPAAVGRAQPVADVRQLDMPGQPLDRKSVVQGKSVSVRVTQVGRRIVKKKKTKTTK